MVRVLRDIQLPHLRARELAAIRQQLSPLGRRVHLVAAESARLHRRGARFRRTGIPDMVRPVYHLCAIRYASVAAEVVHDRRLGVCHLPSDRNDDQQVSA